MKIKDLLDAWKSNYFALVYISDENYDDFLFEGGINDCIKSEFANKRVKYWTSEDIMPDKITNLMITI